MWWKFIISFNSLYFFMFMVISCHQFTFGVSVFQLVMLLSSITGIPLLPHHRKGLAFFLVLIWLWYKTSFFLSREKQETPLYAVLKAMCIVSCNCWLGLSKTQLQPSVFTKEHVACHQWCFYVANNILAVVQSSCTIELLK